MFLSRFLRVNSGSLKPFRLIIAEIRHFSPVYLISLVISAKHDRLLGENSIISFSIVQTNATGAFQVDSALLAMHRDLRKTFFRKSPTTLDPDLSPFIPTFISKTHLKTARCQKKNPARSGVQ
jgi:hypothetical protein